MKKLSIAIAVIAALMLGPLGAAQAQSKGRRDDGHKQRQTSAQHRASPREFQRAVNRQQDRQHARIRQGRKNGSLNRKELSRLHRNQKVIGKMKRRFGADGRYTRHERRIMQGELERSSKRIWRMKHNRHTRKPRYRHYRHFRPGFHKPHGYYGPVNGYYPAAEPSPSHSLGLDVETEEFRFSVNKSG